MAYPLPSMQRFNNFVCWRWAFELAVATYQSGPTTQSLRCISLTSLAHSNVSRLTSACAAPTREYVYVGAEQPVASRKRVETVRRAHARRIAATSGPAPRPL